VYPQVKALARSGDASGLLHRLDTVSDPEETKFAERAVIAFALGTLTTESAIPRLAELVRPNVRVDVRVCAAEALKRIGGPDAARALAPALGDEQYGVRAAAIEAIDSAGDGELTPKLAELAESDPQWLIRARAVEALGATRDDGWIPLLEGIARHDRFLVSMAATDALYRANTAMSIAALKALGRSAPSRPRRLDAHFCLGKARLRAGLKRGRRS
jgi:HEAT repeat protein